MTIICLAASGIYHKNVISVVASPDQTMTANYDCVIIHLSYNIYKFKFTLSGPFFNQKYMSTIIITVDASPV